MISPSGSHEFTSSQTPSGPASRCTIHRGTRVILPVSSVSRTVTVPAMRPPRAKIVCVLLGTVRCSCRPRGADDGVDMITTAEVLGGPILTERSSTVGVMPDAAPAGVFEVVDHRRHVRGVAVHRARQIPHGARVVGIDGQQGPQAGLGDPQLGGDLRPAPALTQNHAHQQLPRLDQLLVGVEGRTRWHRHPATLAHVLQRISH